MLPHASLWALEADVTLIDVMSVEYFTNPSTAPLSVIGGTCATPWRRGIHADSSRAVLPLSCQKTPCSLGFCIWWTRCRCCGRRLWTRLMLPLAVQ